LNVFSLDHTYPQVGKSKSPTDQKRSFFKPKNKHTKKLGVMCDHTGKIIASTPPSACNVPTNTDSNLTTLQAHYEVEHEVHPVFTKYILPEGDEFISILCVDRGYVKHKGGIEVRISLLRNYTKIIVQLLLTADTFILFSLVTPNCWIVNFVLQLLIQSLEVLELSSHVLKRTIQDCALSFVG